MLALLLALHPLHTTMTELTVDNAAHTVRVWTRGFADDFRKASRGATATAYVASHVDVVDGSNRAIVLHDCGTRQSGDLLWMCLEGQFAGDGRQLSMSNGLLCELFDDEVNIVQIVEGTQRRSLLFVKGDRVKRVIATS